MAARPIIRVDDPTSRGGFAIEGFTNYFMIHDRRVAGLGHKVTCPICLPGIHSIIEGSDLCSVDGIPISYDGALTSCGASLIATQQTSRVEIRGRPGIGFRSGMGSLTAAADASPSEAPESYDQHFHLHDEVSGEPLANRGARLEVLPEGE